MPKEDPRPWELAAVTFFVIEAGIFLTTLDSPLFRERESVAPRSEMTMAEAYGDRYTEFAVVCPGDPHAPPVPESRNLLLLRTVEGKEEQQWLRREVVDFCADGQPGFDFRPVDDSVLLVFDEEVGRWSMYRGGFARPLQ